ncbi:MAG: hypothetical protein V4858_07025 [Pseudomonadota bacterium]
MTSKKNIRAALALGASAWLLNAALVSSSLALGIAGQTGGGGEGPEKKPVTGEIRSVKLTQASLLPGTPVSIVVSGLSPTNGKRCDIQYEIKGGAGGDHDSGMLGNNIGIFPFAANKVWKFQTVGTHTVKVWSANADCKGEALLTFVVAPSPFPKLKIGI